MAQNSAEDASYPNLWSRFEWTFTDALYYCQTLFDGQTEAAAEAAIGLADPSDLSAGCGAQGFAWTRLDPAPDAGVIPEDAGVTDTESEGTDSLEGTDTAAGTDTAGTATDTAAGTDTAGTATDSAG